MNWAAMTMRFRVGGTRVQLQGDPSLCKTQVSLRSMMRTIQLEGQGILLELGHLNLMLIDRNSPTRESSPTPAAVVQLVEEFLEIFATPSRLPPVWEWDHAIILKEGTSLVYVRSYR